MSIMGNTFLTVTFQIPKNVFLLHNHMIPLYHPMTASRAISWLLTVGAQGLIFCPLIAQSRSISIETVLQFATTPLLLRQRLSEMSQQTAPRCQIEGKQLTPRLRGNMTTPRQPWRTVLPSKKLSRKEDQAMEMLE